MSQEKMVILSYAITMDMHFDVGKMIEKSIKSTSGNKCIAALPHPSLITQLYQLVKVEYLDAGNQLPSTSAL